MKALTLEVRSVKNCRRKHILFLGSGGVATRICAACNESLSDPFNDQWPPCRVGVPYQINVSIVIGEVKRQKKDNSDWVRFHITKDGLNKMFRYPHVCRALVRSGPESCRRVATWKCFGWLRKYRSTDGSEIWARNRSLNHCCCLSANSPP